MDSRLSKTPLFFFLVGYANLKDFSYLFGAKFTGRKFYRWRHDNWPIGKWAIFHAAPDTAYVNQFFPREFIIWCKSIQAKQADLDTLSLTRLLYDLMHWSSLRSLLKTHERSTCSKSMWIPVLLPTYSLLLQSDWYLFTLLQWVAQNLSHLWRSTLEIGAAQLRSVTEIAPKLPFLCSNRSRISGMVFIPSQKLSDITL